jgi:hypothetical protein
MSAPLSHSTPNRKDSNGSKDSKASKKGNNSKQAKESKEPNPESPKKEGKGFISKMISKVRTKKANEEDLVAKEHTTASGRSSKPPDRFTPYK